MPVSESVQVKLRKKDRLLLNKVMVFAILLSITFETASEAGLFKMQQWTTHEFSFTSVPSTWKAELLHRVDKVSRMCGELCNFTDERELESKLQYNGEGNLPFMKVQPIECKKLFSTEELDAVDLTFPERLPEELLPFYTFSGAIPITPAPMLFKQGYSGGEALHSVWSKEDVEHQIRQARWGHLRGTYGKKITRNARANLKQLNISDTRLLVIGSEKPWVEAVALSLGAKHVTTLEYGKIISEHPKISAHTPETLKTLMAEENFERFDGVISYSSLEHSGLGRYGDALNPWGDLIAFARAGCLTKPNAFFALNVPFGPDEIVWNNHRVYGHLRLPLLTSNWKAVSPHRYPGNRGIDDPAKNADNTSKLFAFEKI